MKLSSALVLLAAPLARAETILITGAQVFDGTGQPPVEADVLIRDERIEAVGAGLKAPPGATVVPAEGKTLLPGLFDLHTHLGAQPAGRSKADNSRFLQSYLYFGVTSVVDFNGTPKMIEPTRRLMRAGILEGPRVHFAFRMSTPGGHGTEGGHDEAITAQVVTPEEGRAAVRRLMAHRPDGFKIFTDGWRYGTGPDLTSMRADTLTAIVEEAHRHGVKVFTHTVTLDKAKIAVRAGVDVLVHGIGNAAVDQELLGLLQKKGTFYASTLAVYEPKSGRGKIEHPLYPDADEPASSELQQPRSERWKFLLGNVQAIAGHGGSLALGTDAGMKGTYHGWATLRELKLLVRGGLTPLQALAVGTGVSARALGVDGERGTIAPGKLADLVIVDGSPHQDIADIDRIDEVFLGGRRVDRARLKAAMTTPGPGPLPAIAVAPLVDDFEAPRSRLDTAWEASRSSGVEALPDVTLGRVLRDRRDHALLLMGRMAAAGRRYVRASVPLTPGEVQPADLRRYRGISFEARGDGEYEVVANAQARATGDRVFFAASFAATGRWRRVRIPFSALALRQGDGDATWDPALVRAIAFEISRGEGESAWLEIDNLRFEK